MPSEKVEALTKADILRTEKTFRWTHQLPKWTVIVNGRELPVRPLVLQAADVPPNDPTNSHRSVAILKNFGLKSATKGSGFSRFE
jgi:hypothetical protein